MLIFGQILNLLTLIWATRGMPQIRQVFPVFQGWLRGPRSGVFKLRLAQRGAIRMCYLLHGTAHYRQQYSANEILAHQNMHKGKHKAEGMGSQLKLRDT